MTILVVDPPKHQTSPPYGGNVLLLSVEGGAQTVVFKVKKFDSALHPHGYKGLFIDTPDKHKAKDVAHGDVIATKGGKVFKVEKLTPKGVKVNPVDPDTGVVKESYTVLGHDVEVAKIEGGKGVGTKHPISDLDPGTYVQHPKSGKKFKISKHGKWTTVYPVDDAGTVKGKHTVLPPQTVVSVAAPSTKEFPTDAEKKVIHTLEQTPEPVEVTDSQVLADPTFHENLAAALWPHLASVYQDGFSGKDDWTEQTKGDIYDAITGFDSPTLAADAFDKYAANWNIDGTLTYVAFDAHFAKRKQEMVDAVNPKITKTLGKIEPWDHETAAPYFENKLVGLLGMDPEDIQPSIGVGGSAAEMKAQYMGYMGDYASELAESLESDFDTKLKTIDEFLGDASNAWDTAYAETTDMFSDVLTVQSAQAAPGIAAHKPSQYPFVMNAVGGFLDEHFPEHAQGSMLADVADAKPTTFDEAWTALDKAAQNYSGDSFTTQDSELLAEGDAFSTTWKQYWQNTTEGPQSQYQEALAKWEAASSPKPKGQQIEEILPTKLPKPPTIYAPGASKDGTIVIERHDTQYTMTDVVEGFSPKQYYAVKRRLPDGSEQLIGTYNRGGQAINEARRLSAPSERIVYEDVNRSITAQQALSKQLLDEGPVGKSFVRGDGRIVMVESMEPVEKTMWNGEKTIHHMCVVRLVDMPSANPQTVSWESYEWMRPEEEDIQTALDADGFHNMPAWRRGQLLEKYGLLHRTFSSEARKGHPEKWIPELQADWSFQELQGKDLGEAEKTIKKLGYREIKPRPKAARKYINARGARIDVSHSQGKVTGIEESQSPFGQILGVTPAHDMHATLEQNLAEGADIGALDPRAATEPAAQTSHVQQLVYDLAVGKQNGIDKKVGSGAKVKSDEAYRAELESEGKIFGPEHFMDQVQEEPLRTKGRGSIVEDFGLIDDPRWEYEARQFRLDGDDLDAHVATMAILNNRGVADQVLGDAHKTTEAETTPELVMDSQPDGVPNLEAASKALAEAYVHDFANLPGMSQETKTYLTAKMKDASEILETKLKTQENTKKNIAGQIATQMAQDLIDERRLQEGTVKESLAEFDLPVWDQIAFEPQTHADIANHVAQLKPMGKFEAQLDVPAFYQGGYFKDGVLMHRAQQTEGKIELRFDQQVSNVLEALGADQRQNPHPIDPGYNGSSVMYDGVAYVYEEGGTPRPLEFTQEEGLSQASVTRVISAVEQSNGGDLTVAMNSIAQSYPDAEARIQMQTFLANYYQGIGKPERANEIWKQLNETPGTRIEYVPHQQPAQGAPTSQRGRFTVYGLSPQEAHNKLMELGLIADLEPQVPYRVVMGSGRRHGLPAPMHPAYLRGEADLPKTPARVTHGMTGDTGALIDIIEQGGLASIEQRHRMGILSKVPTTSSHGDIRSGIDHAVFGTLGVGGACGGGSSVKIVAKPSAFLRRDIVLAPQDYGGCATRYNNYKSYLNKLQEQANSPKTNLYEPVDPRVRQQHFDTVSTSGSNEFNVGPSLVVEDWEHLIVPTSAVAEVNAALDGLMASGQITSRPQVHAQDGGLVSGGVGVTLGNKPTKGLKIV